MKMFVLVRWGDGPLDVRMYDDNGARLYSGHLLCGKVGQWAGALFSGTVAQLTAINVLANVYGIVAVTESGQVKWAELNGVIGAAIRTKLQTWLNNRGIAYTIPADAKYRAIVLAIFKRLNVLFDLDAFDVAD